jgi:ABC-type enterochelin transport system ATPase subunit
MLEIKGLFAGYGTSKKNNYVIRNINLTAKKGESLCILGPNGSGKSTLLKCIARILDYRGEILLEGCDSAKIPRKEFAKKTALLSQSAQVFFPYTIYETVSMGRYAYLQGLLKICAETLLFSAPHEVKLNPQSRLLRLTRQRHPSSWRKTTKVFSLVRLLPPRLILPDRRQKPKYPLLLSKKEFPLSR